MPSTEENFTIPPRDPSVQTLIDFNQDFIAPGVSDYVRLRESERGVVFQLSGTATAFSVVPERSTRDPNRMVGNWSPAEDEPWTGNLVDGVAPRIYDEPAWAWWRLRVASVSGGTLSLSIMGERA